MPWIQTIAPDQAEGELRDIYSAIAGARGGVADVHRVQSLNPRALRAHLEIYKTIVFQRSSPDRSARERVSAANRCPYCVYGEAARQLGDDHEVIAALGRGEIPDALPAPQRALLAWPRRAAVEPWTNDDAGIDVLRDQGCDDRAILDEALTVAYFSFVNRIVLLLGGHIEADYATTCGSSPSES